MIGGRGKPPAGSLLLRLFVGYFRLAGFCLYDRNDLMTGSWLQLINYVKNLALLALSLYGHTMLISSIMNPEHNLSVARHTGNMVGLFSDIVFETVIPGVAVVSLSHLLVSGTEWVRLFETPAVTEIYNRYGTGNQFAMFGAVLALHLGCFLFFFHEVIETIIENRDRTGYFGVVFRLYMVYMHVWYLHLFLMFVHYFKHATLKALLDLRPNQPRMVMCQVAHWMRLNRRFGKLISVPGLVFLASTVLLQILGWFLVFSEYQFDDSVIYSISVDIYVIYLVRIDYQIQNRLDWLIEQSKEINMNRLRARSRATIKAGHLFLILPRRTFSQQIRLQELIAVYRSYFFTKIFLIFKLDFNLLISMLVFILGHVVLIIQTSFDSN